MNYRLLLCAAPFQGWHISSEIFLRPMQRWWKRNSPKHFAGPTISRTMPKHWRFLRPLFSLPLLLWPRLGGKSAARNSNYYPGSAAQVRDLRLEAPGECWASVVKLGQEKQPE